MITKLYRLLDRWLTPVPKETYKKLLSQFDLPSAGMAELPMMLHEFWDRLKPEHFKVGPSMRDMMYISLECRHDNIAQLKLLVTMATNSLIHEDDSTVMELATDLFMVNTTKTMDDYFQGTQGLTLSFYDGVVAVKEIMAYHYRYLENAPSSYHCRVLNKMYNDILTVTRLIVDNMNEGKLATGHIG